MSSRAPGYLLRSSPPRRVARRSRQGRSSPIHSLTSRTSRGAPPRSPGLRAPRFLQHDMSIAGRRCPPGPPPRLAPRPWPGAGEAAARRRPPVWTWRSASAVMVTSPRAELLEGPLSSASPSRPRPARCGPAMARSSSLLAVSSSRDDWRSSFCFAALGLAWSARPRAAWRAVGLLGLALASTRHLVGATTSAIRPAEALEYVSRPRVDLEGVQGQAELWRSPRLLDEALGELGVPRDLLRHLGQHPAQVALQVSLATRATSWRSRPRKRSNALPMYCGSDDTLTLAMAWTDSGMPSAPSAPSE